MVRLITVLIPGKSTIATYLNEELGAVKIDADLLGHQAYAPGTDAYRQVVETFGKGVELEDGSGINRRALGAIVFGQKDKMKQLTDIVWPGTLTACIIHHRHCLHPISFGNAAFASAIRKLALGAFEAVREEAKHSNEDRIAVFEAAVLVEAGWQGALLHTLSRTHARTHSNEVGWFVMNWEGGPKAVQKLGGGLPQPPRSAKGIAVCNQQVARAYLETVTANVHLPRAQGLSLTARLARPFVPASRVAACWARKGQTIIHNFSLPLHGNCCYFIFMKTKD
jgi:dephospho-CoA kinase